MKWITTLLIAMSSFAFLYAQHETLLGDLDVIGAFGSPIVEIGTIAGETGADVGGGGAIILENFFLGGYGLGTDYPDFEIPDGTFAGRYNIKYKHGGLWLGYVHNPHRVAHLFTSTKIGWGKTRMRQNGETVFSDRTFTLVPELGIEINLTDFFKLSLAGGYRWVNGVSQLPGLDNDDFSSAVGVLTFRFGGFGDNDDWDWD
ncbi:MAG: hypothetical protein R3350_05485 [Saprospiraceae bacterium]|nr:hypothetical protein [Saprospiraceae bacterium]